MDFEKKAYELLLNNRFETSGHKYTLPSSTTYPYQWLWDSCFHAIVLSKLEPEMAKEELRSLIFRQFDNGMIPHIIYWKPGDLHKYEWGKDGTSAITQPPIIALSVWSIYEKTHDTAFLREMYKPLMDFYRYIIKERDKRGHHIMSIINPDESGEDNSPRFDSSLSIDDPQITVGDHLKKRIALIDEFRNCKFDTVNCMKKFFWVKDVSFNSTLIQNLKIMSEISTILDEKEHAVFCLEQSELITKAMRGIMFEDGVFWATEGEDYKKIKIDTWAHFVPMVAGIYTKEEASNLVEKYLKNKDSFWSEYGVRTVSKAEHTYNPERFWRGPIWIAVHWFVYKGLKNYGFDKEAEEVKKKSEELISREGFREYYNPETGEGCGAENFTWGTLILDMD